MPIGHARVYSFAERYALEQHRARMAHDLFAAFAYEDFSRSHYGRVHKVDFSLTRMIAGRKVHAYCDNKFDDKEWHRIVGELLSVDRGYRPAIGWLLSSRAGWVLHWLRHTGELVAVPLIQQRKYVLQQLAIGKKSSTCRNIEFLSWNALSNGVELVQACPDALVLNLHDCLPQYQKEFENAPWVLERVPERLATPEILVNHIFNSQYYKTDVSKITFEEATKLAIQLIPTNLLFEEHHEFICALEWARSAQLDAARTRQHWRNATAKPIASDLSLPAVA